MVDEIDRQSGTLLDKETAYARSLADDVTVASELRSGSPMTELASFDDADVMIVVGTHKTGFHYGRAQGSRSLQLVNLVTCPVAVVPELASQLRRGVVVGVDDAPAARAAVELAADMASVRRSELLVVRSSGVPIGMDLDHDDGRRDWQLRRDDQARAVLAGAAERARRRQPDIVIRSRIVRRPAAVALNELASKGELLVIGDSRRPLGRVGTLGPVAYEVLLNLSSPTIVVHAPVVAERAAPSIRAEDADVGAAAATAEPN
jgi:nucleotide-binding universal stress UspA family protein